MDELYQKVLPLIKDGHVDKKLLLLGNVDLCDVYNQTKDIKTLKLLYSYFSSLFDNFEYAKCAVIIENIADDLVRTILLNKVYVRLCLYNKITLIDYTQCDISIKLIGLYDEFIYKFHTTSINPESLINEYLQLIELLMWNNEYDEYVVYLASSTYMFIVLKKNLLDKMEILKFRFEENSFLYIKHTYAESIQHWKHELALDMCKLLLDNEYVKTNSVLYQVLSLDFEIINMIYNKVYTKVDFDLKIRDISQAYHLESICNQSLKIMFNELVTVETMYHYSKIARYINSCDSLSAREYASISYALVKSLDKSIRKFHRIIYQNYYAFTKNHRKTIKILHLIIDENNYNFNTIHDILACYSNLKEYEQYYQLYCKYEEYIFKHAKHPWFNSILSLHVKYISETNNLDSLNMIEKYYNQDEIITPNYIKYNLSSFIHRLNETKEYIKSLNYEIIDNYNLSEDKNCLRDSNGDVICIICLEKIIRQNIILITCETCKKYIGHFTCIADWLRRENRCPHCNS